MSEDMRLFYDGVICALAVVHSHDDPVVAREIIESVDTDLLIKQARRTGSMKWSGLSYYLKHERRKP